MATEPLVEQFFVLRSKLEEDAKLSIERQVRLGLEPGAGAVEGSLEDGQCWSKMRWWSRGVPNTAAGTFTSCLLPALLQRCPPAPRAPSLS